MAIEPVGRINGAAGAYLVAEKRVKNFSTKPGHGVTVLAIIFELLAAPLLSLVVSVAIIAILDLIVNALGFNLEIILGIGMWLLFLGIYIIPIVIAVMVV